jgi:two-component system, NtrC family, nitrogen regulation response regulator NtrX
VDHFVSHFAVEYGRRAKTLDAGAMARLQSHRWPGNVRELRNVIERVAIMAPGDTITERDLAFLAGSAIAGRATEQVTALAVPLYTARDQFEREYIVRQLSLQQGNISRTAEALGVERSNLYRKMRAFGILPTRRADNAEESEEEAV